MEPLQLTYYESFTQNPSESACNKGVEEVSRLLKQAQKMGHSVKDVDTANLTENDRRKYYMDVAMPAVHKRYELRKLLGTNRRSGCLFGGEVPALHVTSAGDAIGDTYPHRKGKRVTTVHDFLMKLVDRQKG
jgi:hypothetical protein